MITEDNLNRYILLSEQNDTNALYEVGVYYFTLKEYLKAFDYFYKAFVLDEPKAFSYMGLYYGKAFRNYKIKKDHDKAIRILEEGCSRGIQDCYNYLIVEYEYSKDYDKIINLVDSLKPQHILWIECITLTAYIYFKGLKVNKNIDKAYYYASFGVERYSKISAFNVNYLVKKKLVKNNESAIIRDAYQLAKNRKIITNNNEKQYLFSPIRRFIHKAINSWILPVILGLMIASFLFTVPLMVSSISINNHSKYVESEAYQDQFAYKFLKAKSEGCANIYRDLYYAMVDSSHYTKDFFPNYLFFNATGYDCFYSSYGVSKEEAYIAINSCLASNANYFWMSSNIYENPLGKLTVTIDSSYFKYQERQRISNSLKEIEEELDNKLQNLVDNSNYNEETVIGTICDFITSKMEYAYDDNHNPVNASYAHNGEAIVRGSGVCEAYSRLMTYFCSKAGIPCLSVTGYVSSDGMGHAWNLVELDNSWYIYDLTYQDSSITKLYYGLSLESYCKANDYQVRYDYYKGYAKLFPSTSPQDYFIDDNGCTYLYSSKLDGLILKTAPKNLTGRLVIPEEVRGIKVKSIGAYALDKLEIEYLFLPKYIEDLSLFSLSNLDKVKTLEYDFNATIYSFASSCPNLEELIIGDNVINVHNPFSMLNSPSILHKVVVGSNVTKFDSLAFASIDSIVEVYNRSNLDITKGSLSYGYIGRNALNIVTKEEDRIPIIDDNGLLTYTYQDKTYLVGRTSSSSILDIKGLDEVYTSAFKGSTDIEEIVMDDQLSYINKNAFNGSNIKKITLNNKVELDLSSLEKCWLLKEIIIDEDNPNYLVDNNVIYSKDGQSLLFVPSGYYGPLIIRSGTLEIKENAFVNTDFINKIVINKEIINIDSKAFDGLHLLSEIVVNEDNENYSSLNGILYNKNQTKVIFIPDNIGKTIELSDKVTKLTSKLFENINYEFDLYIPKSVTNIASNTFYNSEIKDVYYLGTINEFNNINKTSGWNKIDTFNVINKIICTDGIINL